jgi:hypothetical protein
MPVRALPVVFHAVPARADEYARAVGLPVGAFEELVLEGHCTSYVYFPGY